MPRCYQEANDSIFKNNGKSNDEKNEDEDQLTKEQRGGESKQED